MSDDNPFAAPSGEPQRPVAPPDWTQPAYQQPGYPPEWVPPGQQRHTRLVPRSLITACHLSAGGAWVFVICAFILYGIISGPAGPLVFLAFGGVFGLPLVIGLLVAVASLVAAVPLAAVWWGERRERRDDGLAEKLAIAHLLVAWVFAGYVIVWFFTQ
ncbi:MAG TPA: hypothetical protein VF519_02935 [Mycobacteriales bacterium]|jgi:hypothetical protein